MSNHTSNKAVIAALLGNAFISLIKYIVAFITGSAGMLAESVHSTADCLNQVFLLIGSKRSKKERDEKHSMGYGREEYFYGLMVALFLFFVGSLFSFYEGIHKIINPEEVKDIWLSLVVLSIAVVIESISFRIALKEFRKTHKESFIDALKKSTAVSLIVILLEDFAALLGLIIVAITTILSIYIPVFDAIGSILVGVILLSVSYFMTSEIKKLIVGESLDREKTNQIKQIVKMVDHVKHINRLQSMAIGQEKYMVLLSLDFDDTIICYTIENTIEYIKLALVREIPSIEICYIEAKDSIRNNKI